MDRRRLRTPVVVVAVGLVVGLAGCGAHRTSRRIDLLPRHHHTAQDGADRSRRQAAHDGEADAVDHPAPTPRTCPATTGTEQRRTGREDTAPRAAS